jgi:hypothetical protein
MGEVGLAGRAEKVIWCRQGVWVAFGATAVKVALDLQCEREL